MKIHIDKEEQSYLLFTYLGMDFVCLYGYLADVNTKDMSRYIDELKTLLGIDIDKDILKAVNCINKEYDTDIQYTLKELREEYSNLTSVIQNYFEVKGVMIWNLKILERLEFISRGI